MKDDWRVILFGPMLCYNFVIRKRRYLTESGRPNTGGGGGSDYLIAEDVGSGGSGIVIIRNARRVA